MGNKFLSWSFLLGLIVVLGSCRKEEFSILEEKVKFVLPPEHFELAWSDEFDGEKLDLSKWYYRSNGPRREGINSSDAVSIDAENGYLRIATYAKGNNVYTGMIGSRPHLNQRYGYFECRAKVYPINPSFWSAFWLQSGNYGKTLNPEKDGMEIDIMETFFGSPAYVTHAVHWNGYGEHHLSVGQNTYSDTFKDNQFHVFGLEWLPTGYRFFIDNYLVWELKDTDIPISQAEQYVILSCEVGDKELFKTLFSSESVDFLVDYVRVYRWKG